MDDDFWSVPALDAPLFKPLPAVKAGLLYADPPWDFKTYVGSGTPHRTDEDHYATITLDDLKALPVADLAAPDCALAMWTTGSHLEQALELGRAWGFKYKTDLFTWVKTGKKNAEDRPISMGFWTRKQTELCLLFSRGRPKRLDAGVRQLIETGDNVIYAPKREHSRKPAEAYERLERLVGGPHVELFARPWPENLGLPNWTFWGNEMPDEDPYGGL
jgi:N6-adenosine-specific RNA methylase IME4